MDGYDLCLLRCTCLARWIVFRSRYFDSLSKAEKHAKCPLALSQNADKQRALGMVCVVSSVGPPHCLGILVDAPELELSPSRSGFKSFVLGHSFLFGDACRVAVCVLE
jgi:hypothetical protein